MAIYTMVQNQRGEKTSELNLIGRDIEPRELELERTEENEWIKIADSLSENSLSDLNFINAVKRFMSDREIYSGNASELSALLSEYSDDNFSNKVIAKNLKRLSNSLAKADITSDFRRSNGNRIIEIKKTSVDSADQILAS